MNLLNINPSAAAKTCGPGRPKDLEKRAAILGAAKRLFTTQGFDGTSMDAIAAAAGVSKLTVYSHYQDKERLFTAAVECVCQEQMPPEIFNADLKGPIRRQLLTIARAFFELVTSEEALAIHRTIVANAQQSPAARAIVLGSRSQAHAGSVSEASCAKRFLPETSKSPTRIAPPYNFSACSRANATHSSNSAAANRFRNAKSTRT